MWNSRPLPPLHGENHLKFPFWLFEPFPYFGWNWFWVRRVSCVINKAFNLPHYCLGPQDLIHTIWGSHFLFDIWLLERLWCSNFLPNPKNCTKPGLRWKAAIVIRQKGNNCSRTVLRPSSWYFPIDIGDIYFGLETYCTLLRKWQALNYSCYDIPSTPKVWNVLARNQSQFIQVRNLKLEIHLK